MPNQLTYGPYTNTYFQKTKIEMLMEEMLALSVNKDSQITFANPMLLVKGKYGSQQFCINYKALNSIIIKDKFPIPTIKEIIDESHGATYFSKLDLSSIYHHILLKEEDIHKTTFWTHMGHNEFVVMPFGLINTPSIFQALMNKVCYP